MSSPRRVVASKLRSVSPISTSASKNVVKNFLMHSKEATSRLASAN